MKKPGRKLFVIIIFGMFLFSIGRMPQPVIADSEPETIPFFDFGPYSDLAEKAEQEGKVRVIIKIDTAFQAEGLLSNAQETSSQRDQISSLQQLVLGELSSEGLERVKTFETIPYMALDIDQDNLQALIESENVAGIWENKPMPLSLAVSVPQIHADKSREAGFDGSGWTIAVLDSGVQSDHVFLQDKVIAEACFSSNVMGVDKNNDPIEMSKSSCTGGVETLMGEGSAQNCPVSVYNCEHGTTMAGIAAGKSDFGLYGVSPEAEIISIKVVSEFQVPYCSEYDNFGPCALAWNDDILSGLEYVLWLHNNTSINIAVVNLSLGEGYYPSACDDEFPFLKDAVDNLRSVGIATIAAVGDDRYSDGINAPACISSVISAGYESYMANIGADLYAPGELDIVPEPENDFSMARGTSASTAHVSGAWASMRQRYPEAPVTEIFDLLKDNADFGEIRVYEALGLPITEGKYDQRYSHPDFKYIGQWFGSGYYSECFGNNIRFSYRLGDSIELTFEGTQFSLIYTVGPGLGGFDIFVDEQQIASVDQNSDEQKFQQLWDSPVYTRGEHSARLVVNQNLQTVLDGFIIHDGEYFQEPLPGPIEYHGDSDPLATYFGNWSYYDQPDDNIRTNSESHSSNNAGSYAEFVFTGSQVGFIYMVSHYEGLGEVYIDGISQGQINSFYPGMILSYRWESEILPYGEHTLKIESLSGLIDLDEFIVNTDPDLQVEELPENAYLVDDSDPDIVYTGDWRVYEIPGAINDAHRVSIDSDDYLEYSFFGNQIGVVYTSTFRSDIMRVTIDGEIHGFIDQEDDIAENQVLWKSDLLPVGNHTIHLLKDVGTMVAIDGLIVYGAPATKVLGSGTYDDSSTVITYTGSWSQDDLSGATEGHWHVSTAEDGEAEVVFTGKQIRVIYGKDSDLGTLAVYIDEVLVDTIDENAASAQHQQIWESNALSSGEHTLRLVHSSGTKVVLDGLTIFAEALPEAPRLLSPGGTKYTNDPLFIWYADSNASGYWLTVGRSSDGAYVYNSYVTPNTNGYTCWFSLPGALSDGEYWFKVTAGNGSGWGAVSEPMNFKIAASQPPEAPTLISPSGAQNVGNPLFVWYTAENTSGYWLTVGRSSDGAYVYNSYVTPNTNGITCWFSLPGALSDGEYWFKVTAGNASGWGESSEQMEFSISLPQPPEAPALISPNETVDTNTPLFVWYAKKNATGYWLTVGRSSDGAYLFNSYVQPSTNGYTCWFSLPGALSDGEYWFKVTAGNGSGWGAASEPMNFSVSVSQPPAAPTLISPNETVDTNNPLFVWYATKNASGYWLTVGRSSDGAYLFNSYVQPNTNGYTCWLNLPVTFEDGNYWFRVTAGNASGWGDASEQMEFVIEQ